MLYRLVNDHNFVSPRKAHTQVRESSGEVTTFIFDVNWCFQQPAHHTRSVIDTLISPYEH